MQSDDQAASALRAIRFAVRPLAEHAAGAALEAPVEAVCPYCGWETLVVVNDPQDGGWLVRGACRACGTRTRCYSAGPVAVCLPWLVPAMSSSVA